MKSVLGQTEYLCRQWGNMPGRNAHAAGAKVELHTQRQHAAMWRARHAGLTIDVHVACACVCSMHMYRRAVDLEQQGAGHDSLRGGTESAL